MDDKDKKDMEDVIGENLPEAPASVNIKAYYKGYSMMLTRRGDSKEMKNLALDAIKVIDWMETQPDFNPSWNSQTNGVHKKPVDNDPEWIKETKAGLDNAVSDVVFCSIHKEKMEKKMGKFGEFYSHYLGTYPDGDYCNGKAK